MAARLSAIAGFLVAGSAMTVLMAGASAPSPLYPVYRQLWGFSAFTLTVIFAVYVVALLAALLTVGSLSDHVGRRPVVVGGLLLLSVAMLLFISADGVGGLVAARVVQGVATGAITGATSALIVDLQPRQRLGSLMTGLAPTAGLALGVFLSGTLLQWAPWPRYLVFWVLFGLNLVLAALVLAVPEPRRVPASTSALLKALRPSVGVAAEARATFWAQVPAMASGWALGGLYLSLGSSVLGSIIGVSNKFVIGVVLATFFASGAVSSTLVDRLPAPARRPYGYGTLALGVVLTVVAALTSSLTLDVIGSAIAGLGFGGSWVVVMSAIAAVTPAEHRGQTFAAVFVASYLAFSVPALVAGLLVQYVDLRPVIVGYGAFDVLLVALAAAAAVVVARRGSRAAISVG
jgi:MFS family permease